MNGEIQALKQGLQDYKIFMPTANVDLFSTPSLKALKSGIKCNVKFAVGAQNIAKTQV
jgi:hypothetical protein